MAAYSGAVFVENAWTAGIPARIVAKKCRNWGLLPHAADDLADEASNEAYFRSLSHCFHSKEHYRAWISETALNIAIDKLRRESRTRIKLQAMRWLALARPAKPNDESAVATLIDGLATLENDERELLKLTFEDGLTLDQIARQVAASEDGSPNSKRLRIKRKRDRALCKLRMYLIRHGFRSESDKTS